MEWVHWDAWADHQQSVAAPVPWFGAIIVTLLCRIDPTRNMARLYVLAVEPALPATYLSSGAGDGSAHPAVAR
jgi:hypothetical protein